MVFVDNFETDKNTELFKNQVRYVANKWLNQKAKEIFITNINKYSKIIGIRRLQIVILKNLKNRSGSVTKKDTINLNRNLMKAPDDIFDYIIIHELCHLKIPGHSHNFWGF